PPFAHWTLLPVANQGFDLFEAEGFQDRIGGMFLDEGELLLADCAVLADAALRRPVLLTVPFAEGVKNLVQGLPGTDNGFLSQPLRVIGSLLARLLHAIDGSRRPIPDLAEADHREVLPKLPEPGEQPQRGPAVVVLDVFQRRTGLGLEGILFLA